MTSNPKSISLFRNNNDYIGRDFPKAAHLEIRPHPPEKRLVVVHYTPASVFTRSWDQRVLVNNEVRK